MTRKEKGLIIFAREPVPGRVKTRLARDVGDHDASRLYAAMLDDVLELASSLDNVLPLVFWSLETGAMPSYAAFPRLNMLEQRGATLGDRMAHAFETVFGDGLHTCCIIGSDAPDLPAGSIMQAFNLLEQDAADVVFGPAEDGGYYLLGLNTCSPRLFEDIPWSTPRVLESSLERARECGLRTALLPVWYDIDTLEDMRRFLESPGNAPRTRECARMLIESLYNRLPSLQI
jgi:rSAM/selenodomain-associated transferase 1